MDSYGRIFDLLVNKDELTWQTILHDLVKTEQMDPWDIDISTITKQYILIIRKLKELNFRVSGKVLLAAAILLKIKSNRLLELDINEFDRLIAANEESLEELSFEEPFNQVKYFEKPTLIPRTPQPRKRKVSIYDLINALHKALEVKRRRVINSMPVSNISIPKKTRDITQVLREVYGRIKSFIFKTKKNKVTFSQLIPSSSKMDKIYTFIPLLHLSNERKINLHQENEFGEIDIMINIAKKEIDKEFGLS